MSKVKASPYILEIRPRLDPQGDPVAWLLVERVETIKHDSQGELLEASLSLEYKCITDYPGGGRGSFGASFCGWDNSVSITTSSTSGSGGVFLDPDWLQGNRVGTYFFHEVVEWAKQWPDEADVKQIKLIPGQACDRNKARRNSLYANCGAKFIWEDDEKMGGYSVPMQVKDLLAHKTWKQNIYVHDLYSHLSRQRNAVDSLSMQVQDCELRAAKLADELKQAYRKPLRWAVAQTWARIFPAVVVLSVLAVLALAVWNGQVSR